MKNNIVAIILSACIALFCLPLHASVDDQPLSTQEVETALQTLVRTIDSQYLSDKHRTRISRKIQRAISEGEFENSFTFGRFKRKVEAMLIEASGDTNFEIHWRAGMTGIAEKKPEPYPGSLQRQIFDNDIGYIAVEGDMLSNGWQAEWNQAISKLSRSKALIIDLRHAGSMSLTLSQHVLNYFIVPGNTISEVRFAGNKHTSLVTEKTADNPFDAELPVYIITSPFIAGPWELVAYTMKHMNRATLVGMPTMGLGYMTKTVALSPHLNIVLAHAEFRHPATQDNWQDWGVLPHVKCESHDALKATLTLIKNKVDSANGEDKHTGRMLCETNTNVKAN